MKENGSQSARERTTESKNIVRTLQRYRFPQMYLLFIWYVWALEKGETETNLMKIQKLSLTVAYEDFGYRSLFSRNKLFGQIVTTEKRELMHRT